MTVITANRLENKTVLMDAFVLVLSNINIVWQNSPQLVARLHKCE